MAIIQGCTNFKVYKGTRKPQAIKYGSKHVKGWGIDSTTTFPKTFTTTYNDTADVVVKGKTLQKSEWHKAEAQSTQSNPMINRVPEHMRKFEGWTAHQGASVTLTQNISVSEWGTDEATRIQTTGGTDATKYYYNVLTYQSMPVGRKSQIRIYIKNIGSNPVRLFCNQWDNWGDYPRDLVIQPNETKLVVLNGLQTAASHWQISIRTLAGREADDLDFIAYQPEAYLMDEVPQPDNPFPITSNLPAGTYKTQDWKGDWWEFTLTEDLSGIDDVRDSVEWDKYNPSGGWLEKRCGEDVLDGVSVEKRIVAVAIDGNYLYAFYNQNDALWSGGIISTHFIRRQTTINYGTIHKTSFNNAVVMYHTDQTLDTVIKWNAWLASEHTKGTPVTVAYQLATPTRTPLTFTKNNASTAPECPMEFLTDTPSLEYPAEVFDASGTVKVRGKNLFDVESALAYFPNIEYDSDIGITLSQSDGLSWKNKPVFITLPAGTYYFSTTGNKARLQIQDENSEPIAINVITPTSISLNRTTGLKIKILTETSIYPWVIGNFQISATATPYEPYRPEVTATIPALRSVNEVRDTFNPRTGVKVKNNSDWVTLDGDKSWSAASPYSAPSRNPKRFEINNISPDIKDYGEAFVSKFDSTALTIQKSLIVNVPDTAYLFSKGVRVMVDNDDSGMGGGYLGTANEVKAYFYGWKMCHADGRTPFYKSEIPYNPTTWAEWTKSDGVTVDNTGAKLTSDGTNWIFIAMNVTIKANTKYCYLFNVAETTLTAAPLTGTGAAMYTETILGAPVTTGNKKLIFTTGGTVGSTVGFQIGLKTETAGNYVKLKDVRVYELPPGSQIEADFTNLTADQLSEKYPFDGLNVKHWKKLVGTEAEIQASITPTLPTASYAGFTPYKMIYQLAEPIEEQYDPVTLPTYYPTTVIEAVNDTPAEMQITATVKVEDE